MEAIINSMTSAGTRRSSTAAAATASRGSGTSVQEVNQLLKQYAQMRKMFKSMGKPSFARRLAGMKMPGM
jgi:signal recognition particle subunit SRP54